MSRELEARIDEAAARQHGVVRLEQLLEAGLSCSAVDRRARSGRFRRLHRGVFLVLPFPLGRTPEMAAVLATAPGSVLSHVSAGALLELRPNRPGGPVHVAVEGNRRQVAGVRVHRVDRLTDLERTVRDDIPVTSPARTLLDLAGMIDRRELEAAVARAERKGLVALTEVRRLLERRRGLPGTKVLRALLGTPGGPALTRSEAEERFLALVRKADLPPPRCNVTIGRYEVDVFWPAAGLVVEVDGFRYHSSRRSFEGDRRRDSELVAAGFTVLRLSCEQIDKEPMPTVARLASALAHSWSSRR